MTIERSKLKKEPEKPAFDQKTGDINEAYKRTLETVTNKDWKDWEKKIIECNRKGIRKEATISEIIEEGEIEQKELQQEIKKRVSELYDKDKKYFGFDKKHIVQKLEIIIKEKYPSLVRNDLSGAIEIEDIPATETDLNSIRLELNIDGYQLKKDMFYDIMFSKFIPNYHPLRDFFFETC